MNRPINILHLEDNPDDTVAVSARLEAAGIVCRITPIQTCSELELALRQNGVDVILADYQMAKCDGISALQLVQKLRPEIPFIFVAGLMDEDATSGALAEGATDYVAKPDIARLPFTVKRALREAQNYRELKGSEQALRLSEERLNLAMNAAQMGYWDWNIITGEVVWSEECLRLYGLPPDTKMSYELFLEAVHPEDRARVDAALRRAVETSETYDELKRTIWPDGSIHWTASRGQVICDAAGNPIRMTGVTIDVSKWKKTEELYRASERRFEELFNKAALPLCFINTEGKMLHINTQFEQIFGYSREDIPTFEAWFELTHTAPVFRDERMFTCKDKLQEALEKNSTLGPLDCRVTCKDGVVRTMIVSGSAVGNNFLLTFLDVTERMAQLRFFEAMDRINSIIQGTNDLDSVMRDVLDAVLAIFDCDRAFLMYPCDPEADTWTVPLERTRSEFPGVYAQGLDLPMTEEVAATLRLLRATDGPVKFGIGTEHPLPTDVAQHFGFKSFMSTALYPKRGKPWQFGIHQCSYSREWTQEEERLLRDIARRVEDCLTGLLSYRDLRQNEEFLNNIVENIPDMIFVKDAKDLRFVRFNKAGEKLLGYTRQELLGKNDYDFFPKEEADFFTSKDREVLHCKGMVDIPEETIRTRSNAERILHTKKIPLMDEAGIPRYLLGIAEDITERKKSEAALKKSEQFIRNILETVDEGFIVVDRNYHILSANRAYCNLVGISEELVVGRPCYEVSHHRNTPCGGDDGEECAVKRTFETGTVCSALHIHKEKSDHPQYLELKSFPMFDASGAVGSVIETINDVTEKRKLEEQLVQAQKMEAVGRLAGGVAHDFNNMLGAIIGHTELALTQVDRTDSLYNHLQEILKAAGRSADLTRQLLAFARKQTVAPKVLDLNETVEGMLKLLRRLIGEDIHLVWHPGTAIWSIKMDPSQIDQILANLCVNARDAIVGVGKITIETHNMSIDSTYVANHADTVPGSYVLLAVSDDGCGMDKKTIGKIFEPFFTTKDLGKGTGLGLATVYGIVKQNNGFINVYSEEEKGSTFKIYLPRHAAEGVKELEEEGSSIPVVGGNETILVVEDEPHILGMTKMMLKHLGYEVLSFSSPSEAILLSQKHVGKIDLLLTDVVMPEMNGRELARRLLQMFPHLKTLYMSGYTGNVIADHGVLDEGINFIQKPYTIKVLADQLRKVLDD